MTTIKAHVSNYTVGRTKIIDRIVVHYTGGSSDTAEGNGRYFAGADRGASAHFFVDENSVVSSVPILDTAWHAGNWAMNCRSIGVEMCCKKDSQGKWYVPEAVLERTVKLVRDIMARHSIGVNSVIRHYDVTKKNCPAPMVENPVLWENFKKRLTERDLGSQQLTDSSVALLPQNDRGAVAPWAQEAWERAKAKGILDGTRPCDPVTRQELAVVLHRLGLAK